MADSRHQLEQRLRILEAESRQAHILSFSKQADALIQRSQLNELHTSSQDYQPYHVFSRELSDTGAREFLVAQYEGLYARAMTIHARARHFYEIIIENEPCHLYLDIEANRAANPWITEQEGSIMDLLKYRIRSELAISYGIVVKEENFIEMDSSDDKKFSRHLIVRMGGFGEVMFRDNAAAGQFISQLCEQTELEHHEDPTSELAKLFVASKDGQSIDTCIDRSVYSRNRSFRLLFSSKFKAGAPPLFLAPATALNLKNFTTNQQFLLTCVQCKTSEIPVRLIGEVVAKTQHMKSGSVVHQPISSALSAHSSSTVPFPAIAEYVCSKLLHDPAPAFVRSWRVQGSHLSLVIGGSRYCANKGRPHQSNAVYVVVDLATDPPSFTQRCFDRADCHDFKSAPFVIPQHVIDDDVPPDDLSDSDGPRSWQKIQTPDTMMTE